ncbi:MAG: carboxypeptidase-like regulatory domain-containing protein [Dysgonamonadaceae bacterium]|jgi:TPR repeat protein|nr:carboxypeptidase-like regulatory domain-containing protein [Dysgonamonadaceae bacterium]
MNLKRILSSSFILCSLLTAAQAQDRNIAGTVKDAETEKGMVGVSVTAKGTHARTITDADGHYSLTVPANATTLEATFEGYKPVTRNISAFPTVNFLFTDNLEMRAKSGDAKAMASLGRQMFQLAIGKDKYVETALEWLIKAAEKGSEQAYQEIWVEYGQDRGDYPYVEPALTQKALAFLQKKAKEGVAAAQVYLAMSYDYGWFNLKENSAEAKRLYKLSAAQGNDYAQLNVGNFAFADKNYDEALSWYKKSAEQSNGDAAYAIAEMYFKGEGVAQDYAQALQWYEKAKTGVALYQIGKMYYEGAGMAQSYAKAAEYFKQAEEKNEGNAVFLLGKMYYNGEAVPKNLHEALKYFEKASFVFDNEEAKKMAEKIKAELGN